MSLADDLSAIASKVEDIEALNGEVIFNWIKLEDEYQYRVRVSGIPNSPPISTTANSADEMITFLNLIITEMGG